MPEARNHYTTPGDAAVRRELINLSDHPDAMLIELCAEFEAVEAELDRINDVLADMFGGARDEHPLDKREKEGVARIHELRGLISDIPARTPDGLKAKAKVALIDFGPEDEWPENNSHWIAWTLARDVLEKDL